MKNKNNEFAPNMIVVKAENTDAYTKMSNYSMEYILSNIGFEALGVMHKLLSLPNNWHFNKDYFINKYTATKKSRFDTAFRELKKHGFIEQIPLKDNQGHFKGHTLILHEEPTNVKALRIDKAFKKLDQKFGVVESFDYAMPNDIQESKQDNKQVNLRVVK